MYKPTYHLTDYFVQLVDEIAVLQTRIKDSKVSFDNIAKLQKKATILNTKASTTIEGNLLSINQVSAIADKKNVIVAFDQKKEVENYFDALNWINKNYKDNLDCTKICSLHKIICDKLIKENKLGQFRVKQNYVIDSNKIVIFTPPKPEHVFDMVSDLVNWLYSGDRHPIVDCAVFHHQFVTIHPFSDGNGRCARALSQWILYERDFDFNHIYYLDNYYAGDRKKYYQKIQQARELDYDLTHWIEYVAEGILYTLKDVLSEITKLGINPKGEIFLTDRQKELLSLLRDNGLLSTSEIQNYMGVNRARVNQIIKVLVKEDIVGVVGQGRATKYFLRS